MWILRSVADSLTEGVLRVDGVQRCSDGCLKDYRCGSLNKLSRSADGMKGGEMDKHFQEDNIV